jgi:hypothetical protein
MSGEQDQPRKVAPCPAMRSTNPHRARGSARYLLSAATVTCALLGAAGMTASSAASIPPPGNGAALRTSLRDDISQYLATRGTAEHISAVSLRVTFPGRAPGIDLA